MTDITPAPAVEPANEPSTEPRPAVQAELTDQVATAPLAPQPGPASYATAPVPAQPAPAAYPTPPVPAQPAPASYPAAPVTAQPATAPYSTQPAPQTYQAAPMPYPQAPPPVSGAPVDPWTIPAQRSPWGTVPPSGAPLSGPYPPAPASGPYAPPTQYTPTQYTPGQYAPGQPVPGQYAPGQPAPGQYAPGQAVPGQYVPGQSVPGQYVPGQAVPGQALPGQYVPGQAAPGQYPPGQAAPGQYAPGQYVPGQFAPGQFAPGQFVPGQYAPGAPHQYPLFAPQLPPTRRRRWPLWTGLSIVVLALIVACGAVVINRVADQTTANGSTSPTAGTNTPTSNATPTLAPPDPSTLNGALNLQSAALMRGDQAGFLAAVLPSARAAVSEFTLIFHNMRAMHVARWAAESTDGYEKPTATSSPTEMTISYCLVVTACTTTSQTLKISQEMVGDKAMISSVTVPTMNKYEYGPLPWLTTSLSAVTGNRVVVAASSVEAGQLANALKIAQGAVANADKYAKWGLPPVYVLYLADYTEANNHWFGVTMRDSLGLTMQIADTDAEVMVLLPDATRTNEAGPGGLASVIRHEFGHVATLQNDDYNDDDSFVEGIAQYISLTGETNWDKYDKVSARQYIRSGKWSKKVLMTKEIQSSDLLTSNAAYEIGYLALRYLVTKYGLDKMLTFWGDIEQSNQSPDTASVQVFGASWTSVNAAAVTYVKHAVGA